MKKILSLLLALAMLCGFLAGCGIGAPAETSVPEERPAAAETAELPEPTPDVGSAPEPGTRRLILYWNHPSADYGRCDVWIWWDGKDGQGYPFAACDYGVQCTVDVPESVTQVGFIVRRDCSDPCGTSWGDATKDYEADRFAVLTGPVTEIYLKPGEGSQYTSTDGGISLTNIRLFSMAGILSPTEIRYTVTPATRLTDLSQIRVLDGDRALEIASLSSLNNEVTTGVITLSEPLDITHGYTVEIEGFEPRAAVPTAIFDSEEFIARYTYDGDDLGAVVDGDETVFKLWAPTASVVILKLFLDGDGGESYEAIGLDRGDRGVWSVRYPCGHGTYYTYEVTTPLGTQEAVDPYARSVGINGDRGMVVDLSLTDPEGFSDDRFYGGVDSYEQAVIWEVHVRDFSNTIAASQYPGKYLAFTEAGLTNAAGEPVGLDYLTRLGVTHVHLQPVYDYATVDESSSDPQFNWGYDPENYNAPEGSYSTDPSDGSVRVTEFKQMVQALHENGMGVVMDVVYNHTFDIDSNFNRIVPYYYYRFTPSGEPSNGSGCGNETASERVMFRKFMVDSVRYWAEEYHVDGFRFDLMALHDLETMQAVEQAMHAVNPHALLYGEGWTGGASALDAQRQASQANIGRILPSPGAIGGIAVFNDAIRDGLKGSVFDATGGGYINGEADAANAQRVIFGILGGQAGVGANWHVDGGMVINYMSCHDNETLWDKLLATVPDASEEERLAMNRLGASVVFLSRGTPFLLAGEEMLRSKGGDHNSYASPDAVNNLDWEALAPGSAVLAMSDFYRQLIALRRENPFLTQAEPSCTLMPGSAIEVRWTENGRLVAYAMINPNDSELACSLPEGGWTLLLCGSEVWPEGGAAAEPSLSVPACGVLLVRA